MEAPSIQPITGEERKKLWTSLQESYTRNRAHSGAYRFTLPSRGKYNQQFLWDSCFHAMVNTYLDPAYARDELRAVLAHQVSEGPEAGMVPHMNYWDGRGQLLWLTPFRSDITQPPMPAWAAWTVAHAPAHAPAGTAASPVDTAFLGELYPKLAAYYDWLHHRRRVAEFGDLVAILHPWESGWDNSPRWDGRVGPGDDALNAVARTRLAARQRLYGFDSRVCLRPERRLFAAVTVDFNCVYAANLEAMGWIAGALGQGAEQKKWQERAQSVKRALQQFCWSDREGFFFDWVRGDAEPDAGVSSMALPRWRRLALRTPAAFLTLFAGAASEQQAHRLLSHLRDPAQFATAYPVPTVARAEPSFSPDRYWRGTTWVNVNWFIARGLARYSYGQEAAALAWRTARMVAREGLWEYYDSLCGQGLGAEGLCWSGLAWDLAEWAQRQG
ncbi:MAG: hypothetical protein IMW99_09765 [Firmicutes bacterium]|nr:hypothetical protein [Bacillota bacterium]